jgi:hypothetical protein
MITEHYAGAMLPIVYRAFVLINSQLSSRKDARALERDHNLQARLPGARVNWKLR